MIIEFALPILILTALAGLIMAWGIGANDVANAMGTSVGSGAITLSTAILIACIFEFSGAFLAGGEVTSTVRKGILDPLLFQDNPDLFVFGMISALLAAGTWLVVATYFGWPVSTTHTIVGGIVGFGILGLSFSAIDWDTMSDIALSWLLSPLISGTISFFIYLSIDKLILRNNNPIQMAQRYGPIYLFFVAFIVSMVTFTKGLKHIGLGLDYTDSIIYSFIFGLFITFLGFVFLSRLRNSSIDQIFGILMVFTACVMAFAHGSNDTANAVGPVAAVFSTVMNEGVSKEAAVSAWLLLGGGVGIVRGLAMWGYRVIQTIGKEITKLTPTSGFAAELAAATTVVIASGNAMPISTTHTLVGAVFGVGLAMSIKDLDFKVVGKIVASWLTTVPAGAILSMIFLTLFRYLFQI